ncbi:hypothetical protein CRYUN_Cryun23aG0047800 [Craigia yunnanensis]
MENYKKHRRSSQNFVRRVCLPDAHACNSLLTTFCKQGKVGKAFQLCEDMCTNGIDMNIVSYNALINELCKVDNIEKAQICFIPPLRKVFQLLHEMVLSGNQSDCYVYNALLYGCRKDVKFGKGWHLLQEMWKKGLMQERSLIPLTSTFYRLLNGYSQAGNKDDIFSLFEEMVAKGIKPDKKTYYVMIHTHCKEGNLIEALKLRNIILDNGEPGLRLTTATFSSIASNFNRADDMDNTAQALEHMVQFGWVSNSISLADLVD